MLSNLDVRRYKQLFQDTICIHYNNRNKFSNHVYIIQNQSEINQQSYDFNHESISIMMCSMLRISTNYNEMIIVKYISFVSLHNLFEETYSQTQLEQYRHINSINQCELSRQCKLSNVSQTSNIRSRRSLMSIQATSIQSIVQ